MQVIDPGHEYELGNQSDHAAKPQTLLFVKKEEKDGKLELVHDGTSTEQVIDVLIHRLQTLHDRLPDAYTKAARYFLGQAANALHERTADRKARDVEGTHKA